jgi:hypothetical protein
VQNHAQQRTVHPQFAVVLDETQFPEFVHKEAHARAGGPDHLRKRLLADLGRDQLWPAFLSEVCQQKEKPCEVLVLALALAGPVQARPKAAKSKPEPAAAIASAERAAAESAAAEWGRAATEAAAREKPPPLTWKSQIVARLHEHKRYPEEAKSRREQGVAQVFSASTARVAYLKAAYIGGERAR